ncbi:hypothetical protein GCM10009416_37360 [Craurococcus roseus]|uniref:Lipoprotein n=1 Tax=Craurococcus roseus TaxID=77585 RepID=A0ABP3QXJ9_9PROT
MPRETRTPRPVPVLAALGMALTGCGLPPSDGPYSYGGGSGHYSSPGYHHRPYSHHRRSESHKPRTENWSQQRLQQHWQNQAARAR